MTIITDRTEASDLRAADGREVIGLLRAPAPVDHLWMVRVYGTTRDVLYTKNGVPVNETDAVRVVARAVNTTIDWRKYASRFPMIVKDHDGKDVKLWGIEGNQLICTSERNGAMGSFLTSMETSLFRHPELSNAERVGYLTGNGYTFENAEIIAAGLALAQAVRDRTDTSGLVLKLINYAKRLDADIASGAKWN